MPYDKTPVEIRSRDYWFKIVEFLQQNWALIDDTPDGCVVFFIGDNSGIFDRLAFLSVEEAKRLFAEMALLYFRRTKRHRVSLLFRNRRFMNGRTQTGRFFRPRGSGVKGPI